MQLQPFFDKHIDGFKKNDNTCFARRRPSGNVFPLTVSQKHCRVVLIVNYFEPRGVVDTNNKC